MNDWLDSIYTIFDRIGDFLSMAYNAIVSGVSYISGSVSSVLSLGGILPAEMVTTLALVIGVCVLLLILGR